MALAWYGYYEIPSYTALSTDIEDNQIEGANAIGRTIYLTDTDEWKIITQDLTLEEFVFP